MDPQPDCCPECKRMKHEVEWAQECIIELQHVIRELRHEVANLTFITYGLNSKAAA